ncbi:hypothetical protein LCGC14_0477030 [marine sediment metagenome]|uniref:Uncharacterized protein n=1 Tax=marine sediment metagenome TaxID=412755 RepID=A0A0F9UXH0_9ZZZZ
MMTKKGYTPIDLKELNKAASLFHKMIMDSLARR